MTTLARAAAAMTEAELQGAVIQAAHALGWQVAHFRPARTERGWRTAVAADGGGFPDLVLVRERVVFAELKAGRGRVSPHQALWLSRLEDAGAETYVWRPTDWLDGSIIDALTAKREVW